MPAEHTKIHGVTPTTSAEPGGPQHTGKSEPEQLSILIGIRKQMEKGRLVTCFVSPVSFYHRAKISFLSCQRSVETIRLNCPWLPSTQLSVNLIPASCRILP